MGERLFQHFVRTEAEQFVDSIVGLQDAAFQVGDEDRVGRVLDQTIRVRQRFVQLTHVAQDADGANDFAVLIA